MRPTTEAREAASQPLNWSRTQIYERAIHTIARSAQGKLRSLPVRHGMDAFARLQGELAKLPALTDPDAVITTVNHAEALLNHLASLNPSLTAYYVFPLTSSLAGIRTAVARFLSPGPDQTPEPTPVTVARPLIVNAQVAKVRELLEDFAPVVLTRTADSATRKHLATLLIEARNLTTHDSDGQLANRAEIVAKVQEMEAAVEAHLRSRHPQNSYFPFDTRCLTLMQQKTGKLIQAVQNAPVMGSDTPAPQRALVPVRSPRQARAAA